GSAERALAREGGGNQSKSVWQGGRRLPGFGMRVQQSTPAKNGRAAFKPSHRAFCTVFRQIGVDHALGFEMKHCLEGCLETPIEHDLVKLDCKGGATRDSFGEAQCLLSQ